MSSPVEQIKERLDVVTIIQSYIKLQKAGANFKTNCPFHSEKTPSFFVSPARGIWHCFGCGLTGDIFEFIKRIEGVEFPEALKILADRAGIEIKKEDPRMRDERVRLLQLLETATSFYENQLKSHPEALDYLKGRGLKQDTIKSFRLGYVSGPPTGGWKNIFNFLTSRGYKESEIEKAGLAIKSSGEQGIKYYDRFRNRIMFPLFDSSGRIVGFSGRIFAVFRNGKQSPDQNEAKYINTPQTALYDKSKILYGFNRAKSAIRQNDACLLVEGQMDLIMCHQEGITNAVAVSGTALTPHHLNLIKRLTNNLITAFDMDEAGSIATKRGVDLAIAEGFEVRVAAVPLGKDPADAAKENPDILKESIKKAKHIITFFIESLNKKIGDPRILKQEVAKIVLPYVIFIQSPIEKSHWVSEIASSLGMKEEPIWEELKKINKKSGVITSSNSIVRQSENQKRRRDLLEERLLGVAFWKNETLGSIKSAAEYFSKDNNSLLETGLPKDQCQRLAFEAEILYSGMDNLEPEIRSLLKDLKKETIKERLEATASLIKATESKDKEKYDHHLNEFQKLSKELSNLLNNKN